MSVYFSQFRCELSKSMMFYSLLFGGWFSDLDLGTKTFSIPGPGNLRFLIFFRKKLVTMELDGLVVNQDCRTAKVQV